LDFPELDAFREELRTIKLLIHAHQKKTIRNEDTLERIRLLYRSWQSIVAPTIEAFVKSEKDYYKIAFELSKLAKLTSKVKGKSDYTQRLNCAHRLLTNLVLVLPLPKSGHFSSKPATSSDLFLPEIPDLPHALVPNSISGWREEMRLFLQKHPFDSSVFIMVRYRDRNKHILSLIKKELRLRDYHGIVATDYSITDDLYNPIACLLCCARGIAIFDQPESLQEHNPNVAYELGMLNLLGRKHLILKHDSLQSLHTDILMKLYKEYANDGDVRNHLGVWLDTMA
jgi:hypothetical protein